MDLTEVRQDNDRFACVRVFDEDEYFRVMQAHNKAVSRNPVRRHFLDLKTEYGKPKEYPFDMAFTFQQLGSLANEMVSFKTIDEIDFQKAHQIFEFLERVSGRPGE